jgi:hypothetical protein
LQNVKRKVNASSILLEPCALNHFEVGRSLGIEKCYFLLWNNYGGNNKMSADEFQRRFAAILSADVVDYSRLMAEDEVSTVRTLNA